MAAVTDILGILLLLAGLAALFWLVRLVVGILVGAAVCLIVLFIVMSFWVPGPLEPVQSLLLIPVNFVRSVLTRMGEALRVLNG